MPAMIRRDAHKPQACSGGSTALTCRNVAMLTNAAERDRNDPRVGIDSVMRESQHVMVTFVNGNVGERRFVVPLGLALQKRLLDYEPATFLAALYFSRPCRGDNAVTRAHACSILSADVVVCCRVRRANSSTMVL